MPKAALLILTRLPKEYEVVATVLEVKSEGLSTDRIVAHLLPVKQRKNKDQEARQKYRSTTHAQYNTRRPSAGRCSDCDKPWHIKADCKKPNRNQKERGTQGTRRVVPDVGAGAVLPAWLTNLLVLLFQVSSCH